MPSNFASHPHWLQHDLLQNMRVHIVDLMTRRPTSAPAWHFGNFASDAFTVCAATTSG
ncbi:MAG: hypothetical protein ACO1OB_24195 [Archangium sp.]